MLSRLKDIGRAIIPRRIFRAAQPLYHGTVATLSSWFFGRPSEDMIVIGVTGTAGKSTTINLLAAILKHASYKTGFSTTTNYSDGNQEHVNKHGLSMPGGFMLQQQLHDMVENDCRYAIIECTSEGLAQNRHFGIKFDMALLTSIAPAHLDAHGGMERYRAAKGRLFSALNSRGQKILGANLDTTDPEYFLNFPAALKFGISLKDIPAPENVALYHATRITTEPSIKFTLNDIDFNVNLLGEFNVYNILLAVAAADMLGVSVQHSADALRDFAGVSGRMQNIINDRGFKIFVDYAPEPLDMSSALQAINRLPHHKIIHVFGSTGGHRDVDKRFEFGKISASLADSIIITNDDVYDSDPTLIAKNVKEGIEQAETKKVAEVLTILDRREAINKALRLAQRDDIIIITGKGSEQFLVLPGNTRIPWDEPSVVKEELAKL